MFMQNPPKAHLDIGVNVYFAVQPPSR
jgi:hypothetical protein